MKIKLTVFVILTALIFMTLDAQAQQRSGQRFTPEQMAKQRTKMMQQQLNLTKEQVQKVEKLNLEFSQQMRKVWSENRGDRDAMRTKMTALVQKTDEDLQKVFTPDQWKKWQDYRRERFNRQR